MKEYPDIFGEMSKEEFIELLDKNNIEYSHNDNYDIERWNSENTMIVDSDEYKYLTSMDELINTSRQITKILEKIRDKEYYKIKNESGKDICRLTEVSHRLEFSEKWIKGIYERRYDKSNL